ncbi:MAG TPA: glucodextranase DOMON-like domain-containing protein [Myxococcota bacterium]|nr:glucodextranase DOMON-like domain-containing protein [Myxococcota bacterium]
MRLEHPEHPGLERHTFDLTRVSLSHRGREVTVEATFAAPVRELDYRAARDRAVVMVPMTLDVYLDLAPGGRLDALPGRGVRFPAAEGWERVLVVSGLPDLSEDGLIHAHRVSIAGRTLKAVFELDLPVSAETGVQVVVLATSMSGEGRVRAVGRHGECRVWDDFRCVLIGEDPPVLDALGEVSRGAPLAMIYAQPREAPAVARIPVVFVRGKLVGVAPVGPETKAGQLATLYDGAGVAKATAVVLSVVGDTASLEVVSGDAEGAATVELAP